MPDKSQKDLKVPYENVLLEAIKGIKNEILLYSIVIVLILISSAYFGIEVLREVELPLIVILTITLILYILYAFLQAKKRVGEEHERQLEEERKRRLEAEGKKPDTSVPSNQINIGNHNIQVSGSKDVSINKSPSQAKKR